MSKQEKSIDTQRTEPPKNNTQELEDRDFYPIEADFSLQTNTFAPGENSYLNEYPGVDRSYKKEEVNKEDFEFSEELSDGGERDEFVKKLSSEDCGGL